jgi:hypothetical protein
LWSSISAPVRATFILRAEIDNFYRFAISTRCVEYQENQEDRLVSGIRRRPENAARRVACGWAHA